MFPPGDISITTLFLSIIAGYLLGIVSGLIPGIHTNNFAMFLVALSTVMADYGITTFYAAIIILSNAITHTFHDIIPSIFLGALNADIALAVLLGHQLLLAGSGAEAIKLSALGSAGSIIFSSHRSQETPCATGCPTINVKVGIFYKETYQVT